MDRLISEQAVIDTVSEWLYDKNRNESIEDMVKAIPSTEPIYYPPCEDCHKKMNKIRKAYDKIQSAEPKTGHWILSIEDWNKWTCSECGYSERTDIHVSLGYDYCPKCGARMFEPQERSDK